VSVERVELVEAPDADEVAFVVHSNSERLGIVVGAISGRGDAAGGFGCGV
jgi:hypothetical protein